MGTPNPRRLRAIPGSGPAVRFYLHRLGQLEAAYRDTGERALLLLDPRSDEAAAIRRVLLSLDL